MKKGILTCFLFLMILPLILAQTKRVRIGPGPHLNKLPPIVFCDGIPLSTSLTKQILKKKEKIASVSVLADSVFDCKSQLKAIGMVTILTKDSLHGGAKRILKLSGDWIYQHPSSDFVINNKRVELSDEMVFFLFSLQENDIISASGRVSENGDGRSILYINMQDDGLHISDFL